MNTFLSFISRRSERGGLFLGLIIGLLLGLVTALLVALYVARVPTSFAQKSNPMTPAEQDIQEAEKNKNWNPNAPLYGKNVAKPIPTPTVAQNTPTAPISQSTTHTVKPAASPAAQAKPAEPTAAAAVIAPKPSADPLGDLAKAKGNASAAATSPVAPVAGGVDPFAYFVQAGAFRNPEDAETQKAKLAMAGFEAQVTEREQSGRTVYRVRVGPLGKSSDADKLKEKLDATGFETAIVRVQR
jgi:cell division protein FtsN